MRKLLLSIFASVALVLGASATVLAQGSSTPPDQYEPVPASEGRDQYAMEIENPDEPQQYGPDAPISPNYQYATPADCGDSPCEVDEDVDDVVEDAAEDASGSAEDLAGALDAATSYANGEDRPAFATEIAEDPANDDAAVAPSKTAGAGYDAGPPDEDETAPPARSADGSGADEPEGAGRSSGGGGPDGAIVLDELPATGGTLLVPVALGAGVFLLLLVGGPLLRSIVR